ncbi:MAG: flavodoxin domain-containing protein [Candidatus Peribacteraceae bacterium]|jgi:flavodoxin|nr:flavodoxin domain-containing protein [Candidatus Peribacteraceae bacterium]|tara:strand:+ start:9795 stop:10265 length:471 start_codon:yes stop_codon:yes gene_type:complete
MPSLHIIYASTSGNTQHVVDTLIEHLAQSHKEMEVTAQRAEEAQPEDLTKSDVLVLASGTWNYDGVEGYLNMHMRELLEKRAKDTDLAGCPIAFISLGDDRYYYTGRATERFMQFAMEHNGKSCCMPLIIINDPYGQEEKVTTWCDKLMECFTSSE